MARTPDKILVAMFGGPPRRWMREQRGRANMGKKKKPSVWTCLLDDEEWRSSSGEPSGLLWSLHTLRNYYGASILFGFTMGPAYIRIHCAASVHMGREVSPLTLILARFLSPPVWVSRNKQRLEGRSDILFPFRPRNRCGGSAISCQTACAISKAHIIWRLPRPAGIALDCSVQTCGAHCCVVKARWPCSQHNSFIPPLDCYTRIAQ